MTNESPSVAFEAILRDLEERRKSYAETRRGFTKTLVAQTNDEVRSGMPYIADIASMIASSNSAELFLDGLINGIQSNSRNFGEETAMRRALRLVLEEIKTLDPNENSTESISADDLHGIGIYILDGFSSLSL